MTNSNATTPLRSFSFALALSLGALFGLVGCDPAPVDDDSADQPASEATSEDPLRATGGGGGGQGFTCSGLLCTCTGDDDCNDMFGSGKCGDISSCDTSGPEPICSCLMFRKPPKPPVTAPKATTNVATLANAR